MDNDKKSDSDNLDLDAQIGIRLTAEQRELIEQQLEYGDSLSEWIRGAVETPIEREGLRVENRMPAALEA